MSKIHRKRRMLILSFVFVACFLGLLIKLLFLQVYQRNDLVVKAEAQYYYEENINELNYSLLDCNGKELIEYKNKYLAVVDPYLFLKNSTNSNIDDLYALIYILRNYNEKYDLSKIAIQNTTQKMIYEVDEATYNKLERIKGIKGFYTYIYSEVDRSEAWKLENLLTATRRPIDGSLKDGNSLEMEIYNKTKENKMPKIRFNKDINGNIEKGQFILPTQNINVQLTIDKNIQDAIKEVLSRNEYKKLNQVGVILMEANTGKIRGFEQKDDTLPNVNIGSATENGFYPGSIYKAIVEEAAIEKSKIVPSNTFECEIGKNSLCKKPHGTLTAEQAFVLSCNNIFAKIGSLVGFNNFLDNSKLQGLFNKVLGLDSEVKGDFVEPIQSQGGTRLVSIGQNMRITPIQAIAIPNTIINKGLYIKPTILEGYLDNSNTLIEKPSIEKRTVLNTKTAEIMQNQMLEVVREGTGTAAFIEKFEVGGKTGTTERADKDGKHSDGWFVGFFKLKNTYYSMVVFVKDIDKDRDSGGTVAAPIFKQIVEEVSKVYQ